MIKKQLEMISLEINKVVTFILAVFLDFKQK